MATTTSRSKRATPSPAPIEQGSPESTSPAAEGAVESPAEPVALPDEWPKCACGEMRVAPGTRTELAGVSHGETPCFHCDTYGRPVMEEAPAAHVIEAIARVKRDLPGIAKGETAPGAMGGYAYRGIEQLTAHLQDLTAKHGIVIVPDSVLSIDVTEFETKGGAVNTDTRIHYRWAVYGPGGATDVIYGENICIGRDNFDKGASKAGTQGFKEFLIKLFCIGEKATDPDGSEAEERLRRTQDTDGRIIGQGEAPAKSWFDLGWSPVDYNDAKALNAEGKKLTQAERNDLREGAKSAFETQMKGIKDILDQLPEATKSSLMESRKDTIGPLPFSVDDVKRWEGMVTNAYTTFLADNPQPETTEETATEALQQELGATEVTDPDSAGVDPNDFGAN